METTDNLETFVLASDDAYEGRCCEVFFTRKRLMVFHCSLCDDNKYASFSDFLEHLARQHRKDWATVGLAEADETAVKHVKSVEAIDSKEEFEEYELLEVESMEETEEPVVQKEYLQLVPEDKNGDVNSSEFVQETLEITPLRVPHTHISTASAIHVVNAHYNVSNTSQDNSHDSCSPSRKRKKLTKKEATSNASAAAARTERQHKCEHCGFAFKQLFNLRAHLRRHTDPKPFGCTQCSKQFHTRSELETHARRHTGEKPYVCTQCGAAYVSSGALSEHTKRHINYRPHVCPHCPKSFYDTYQLSEHVVVHTQQRNHVCELCRATFQRRKSLVGHMKLHLNAREYACTLCPAAFNQHQALTAHIKHKHKVSSQESGGSDDGDGISAIAADDVEGIPFCIHCQLEFADAAALFAHEELLHAHVMEEFVLHDVEKVLVTEQLDATALQSLLAFN